MRKLPVFCVMLLLYPLAGRAYAGACVTDKCHSIIGKEQYVHGPVAVGECTACHEKLGEHRFAPISNVKGLCAKCHDAKTGVHCGIKTASPGDHRECGNCHDAHQSSRPQLLLVKSKRA